MWHKQIFSYVFAYGIHFFKDGLFSHVWDDVTGLLSLEDELKFMLKDCILHLQLYRWRSITAPVLEVYVY